MVLISLFASNSSLLCFGYKNVGNILMSSKVLEGMAESNRHDLYSCLNKLHKINGKQEFTDLSSIGETVLLNYKNVFKKNC